MTTETRAVREIVLKGARVHNLKNMDLRIPRNKFIVVTGLSGSGKSSLAFDTLFAEGQRRYVESLSSYARQFLGRISKPEVDYIRGIPPAIAIEQKVNTRNPRSTVGTSTEIYDYLKLLFSRLGKTISPVSGKEVKRHQVSDVVNFICSFPEETRILICSPLHRRNGRPVIEEAELLLQQGFSRVESDNRIERIADLLKNRQEEMATRGWNLVIDRLTAGQEEQNLSRMADSIETAFFEGQGECLIKVYQDEQPTEETFSSRFEADGIS
ncbi:MAG: excinuclease ABC subunit A, partial [Mangrovibacterium sp.]